jgi:HEPN domain
LPTQAEHLAKAVQNEGVLRSLNPSIAGAAEWSITVAFYAAVHYVQSYLVANDVKSSTHTSRANAIRRDARLQSIYDDYRELENMSRDARYDSTPFSRQDVDYALECLKAVRDGVKALL